MVKVKCKPVFIIGKQRTGTTWLANILAEHPDICAICHPIHEGIHESGFFSHLEGRYGSLSIWSNYMEFVQVVSRTDYFRLAGCSKQLLFSMWPDTSYGAVFKAVMDSYAEKNGCSYWLEKSPRHALYIDSIVTTNPEAIFVGIYRNCIAVAQSSLYQQARAETPFLYENKLLRLKFLSVESFMLALCNKSIKQAMKRFPQKVYILSYENLQRHTKKEIGRILKFIGVDDTETNLVSRYDSNSSYRTGGTSQELTMLERIYVKLVYHVVRCIPVTLLKGLYLYRKDRRRQELPTWFFKLAKRDLIT